MSTNIKTAGVHHVTLRSADLARSKPFYAELLGLKVALEAANIFIFAGAMAVAVRGPKAGTRSDDRFNPFRVGLNHIALACEDEGEIGRIAAAHR